MSNHVHEAIKEKEALVAKLQREIESLNAYIAKHETSETTASVSKQRKRRRTKAEMAQVKANGEALKLQAEIEREIGHGLKEVKIIHS